MGTTSSKLTKYIDQVEEFSKICDAITKKYGNETIPKGLLAWPCDLELLERYGVPINEIAERLSEIIKETNIKIKDCVDKTRKENPNALETKITIILNAKYKVEAEVIFAERNVKEFRCAYCHKMKIYNTTYRIINLFSEKRIKANLFLMGWEASQGYLKILPLDIIYKILNIAPFREIPDEMSVPNVMEHLVKKHGELGEPGPFRLNPTKICNLLWLGNTHLPKNDSLFKIAKYNDLDAKDLQPTLVNNKEIYVFDMNATLMMSSTSGRDNKRRKTYEG